MFLLIHYSIHQWPSDLFVVVKAFELKRIRAQRLIHLPRTLSLLSHHWTPKISWSPDGTRHIDSNINLELLNSKDFSESPSLYLVYWHILSNENWVKIIQYSWTMHLNILKMCFSGLNYYTTANNCLSYFFHPPES